MRILMLAHRLPYPPHTGDKVRAYHVARHLAAKHELTLACLADEAGSERARAALSAVVPRVESVPVARRRKRLGALLALVRGRSATMSYFDSSELRRRVLALAAEGPFDLVYVSSSSMAQYAVSALRAPIVMDFVDMDSDKWLQYGRHLPPHRAWVYRLESRRLRAHELLAARQAAISVVVTAQEKTILHAIAPGAPTVVVPNGVDLNYFEFIPSSTTNPHLVFTGGMDYLPNVDAVTHFCEAIFPLVRGRIPHARFTIVGRDPAPAVRRLSRLPGVVVTGSVPDVRPFFRDAAVAVAPLRLGRGVQNKVLEAMAAGVPIVATTKAHEGLAAEPGQHLLLEDQPDRFAAAVVALLSDPARRAELGRQGRRFVEQHHAWPAVLAALDGVIDHVLNSEGSDRAVVPDTAPSFVGERM